MNRKGGDRIISIYWFTILFIVAAAIVYMVAVFYGKPYDVREIEADILMDRVSDCVSKAGYLLDSALEENFLENCGLNFDVEDIYGWGEEGQYFVEVNIKDFLSLRQITSSSKKGNEALKEFCNLEGDPFRFYIVFFKNPVDKIEKCFIRNRLA